MTEPAFERGDEVIVVKYPADTGKPSPVGLRGRIETVGSFLGERGRLYTVAMDIRNPDSESGEDPYSWVFFEDEMDAVEEDK